MVWFLTSHTVCVSLFGMLQAVYPRRRTSWSVLCWLAEDLTAWEACRGMMEPLGDTCVFCRLMNMAALLVGYSC